MLRIGLFLYDHLSFINKLPRSKLIKRRQQSNYFHPLNDAFNTGFIYYDCYADDARLTLVNALQAKQHGASILPQTKLVNAQVKDGLWQLMLQSKDGALFQIQTKVVINTAGPWVETITQLLKIPLAHSMTLVKGSHLVVKKLYEGQHAYMLQHDDKRIIFVIPYHGYSMVGTTDVLFQGDINTIQIDDSEINYLCSLVNHYFNKPLSSDDIITTWSGVRPLLSDPGTKPSALSRDYTYHYTNAPAPAITVYGGKITTYRQLAVQVIDQLKIIYPDLPESSTAIMALPGATLNDMNFMDYQDYARKKYNWLDK
jgi:glycerol-3-phosphate dehydrogenase